MTKRQTEETINEAGRSTYPDEKSVLRNEATRTLGVAHDAQLAGVTQSANELKARAEFFQMEFAVPFRLITGLLTNIPVWQCALD